jgi:hypothetical protein
VVFVWRRWKTTAPARACFLLCWPIGKKKLQRGGERVTKTTENGRFRPIKSTAVPSLARLFFPTNWNQLQQTRQTAKCHAAIRPHQPYPHPLVSCSGSTLYSLTRTCVHEDGRTMLSGSFEVAQRYRHQVQQAYMRSKTKTTIVASRSPEGVGD